MRRPFRKIRRRLLFFLCGICCLLVIGSVIIIAIMVALASRNDGNDCLKTNLMKDRVLAFTRLLTDFIKYRNSIQLNIALRLQHLLSFVFQMR